MSRPRLLDLFCGAGGAAMGYHRAGFEVIGVDINPQPNYPFEFVQANALDILDQKDKRLFYPYLVDLLGDEVFDAIHASPPCQTYTRAKYLRNAQGGKTAALDLVDPTRRLLKATGLPYVIENVPGAPLLEPVTVCGSSFGLKVRRHRNFESNITLTGSVCDHNTQGRPVGVYHVMGDEIPKGGRTAKTLEEGQEAMGIDWMPWKSLKEAIPPAYAEFIGLQLLNALANLETDND